MLGMEVVGEPVPSEEEVATESDDDEDETTEAYSGGGLNTLMRTR